VSDFFNPLKGRKKSLAIKQKNMEEEHHINVPNSLLQDAAKEDFGRLLTDDELVEVGSLVVEEAMAAIQESIKQVVKK
jgi:hypothetical protein